MLWCDRQMGETGRTRLHIFLDFHNVSFQLGQLVRLLLSNPCTKVHPMLNKAVIYEKIFLCFFVFCSTTGTLVELYEPEMADLPELNEGEIPVFYLFIFK